MDDLIVKFVFGLIVLVVIGLIFREIVCWYLKINDRIELSRKLNKLIEQLSNSQRAGTSSARFSDGTSSGKSGADTPRRICPGCGAKAQAGEDTLFCGECGARV